MSELDANELGIPSQFLLTAEETLLVEHNNVSTVKIDGVRSAEAGDY